MNSTYILFTATTVFAATYFISTLQILIKLCGALPGNIAIAHNFSSFVILINKVMVSIAMLLFALAADITFNQIHFGYCLIWFGFLTTILHICILKYPDKLMTIISKALSLYGENQNRAVSVDRRFTFKGFSIIPSLSMAFFLLGFTFPMLFINTFPEFRSTIIQFSTILNGIGSILSVTVVERRLATHIDKKDISSATKYANIVISSRLLTSAVITLLFVFILIIEL